MAVPARPRFARPRSRSRLLERALAGLALALAFGCAHRPPPAALPGAPHFPDFVFPAAQPDSGTPATLEQHRLAWQSLQAGDLRNAERSFDTALKLTRGFYPAEAGLGYAALARKDEQAALLHFERAIAANPGYAPALAGRGDAFLASGKRADALISFEAALNADASLGSLRSRIEVLRFRGLQDDVSSARKAAETGHLAEAKQTYLRAITASPQSTFLYRELAAVERQDGDAAAALAHAQQASALDPDDARNQVLIGDIQQSRGETEAALQAFSAALALGPDAMLETRIAGLRARTALAAMPAEYQAIDTSASLTRAQLAALIGVRLDALLGRSAARTAVVMTDTRNSWALPWILSVTRAGVMDPYPNHTFQPSLPVRRADLVLAASRVLDLVARERPALAAGWRKAGTRRFPDVGPGHLNYPAVSLVVAAGVMTATPDGTFQLALPATGPDAVAAVARLVDIAGIRTR